MNKAYLNDSTLSKEDQKNMYSLRDCPVCKGTRLHYLFSIQGYRVVRCEDCGLMMLNPQPSDEELSKIYGLNYFLLGEDERRAEHRMELKQATADRHLDLLARYCGEPKGKLLEVGCGQGVIVLTEAYLDQDFLVTVNGMRSDYIRVNHAFKGVVKEPGTYEISFDYWPPHLTLALWIATIGVLLLCAWIFFYMWQLRMFSNVKEAAPLGFQVWVKRKSLL